MKTKFIFLFLSLVLCACSKSDDDDDKSENSDINIVTDFNTTRGSATVVFDESAIPLDGMFVSVLKNSIANEIIVNLAPAGTSGSMADIGLGWAQFRFNTGVELGITQAQKTIYPSTVISTKILEPQMMEGIYRDETGKYWELAVGPEVTHISVDHQSENEYHIAMNFSGETSWRPWDETLEGGTKNGRLHVTFGINGQGPSSDSIIGTWRYRQANCDTDARITFKEDNTGNVYIPDCNHVCADGNVTYFNWSTSGSQLIFDYTKFTICGTEQTPPQGGSVSYSLNGDELTIGSQTWER